MKRFLQLILLSIFVGLLCLWISQKLTEKEHSASGEKIYVYNWGEYIDPSLVKNSKRKLVLKLCTRRLILMRLWKPKYAMVEQIMMLLFQVNIR